MPVGVESDGWESCMRPRVLCLVALVLTVVPVSLLAQAGEQSVEPASEKPESIEAVAPCQNETKSKQESSDATLLPSSGTPLAAGRCSGGRGLATGPYHYPYAYPLAYALGFTPGIGPPPYWYPISSPYLPHTPDAFLLRRWTREIGTTDRKEAKVWTMADIQARQTS